MQPDFSPGCVRMAIHFGLVISFRGSKLRNIGFKSGSLMRCAALFGQRVCNRVCKKADGSFTFLPAVAVLS